MKKVTPKQIERLYEFTRQHYVEYFDVQTELVDHLANAIETHWKEFPDDDFETVLQKEFRKFGVFGFSDVVEQKTKQMNKRYNRLLWAKCRAFFTPLTILITLIIWASTYEILRLFSEKIVIVTYSLLIVHFITLIVLVRKNKRIAKQKKRKWLFEDVVLKLNNFAPLLNSLFAFHTPFYQNPTSSEGFLLFFSAAFTITVMLTYIVLHYLPKNYQQHMLEIYPEYAD